MRVLEGRYLDRADPEKGRFRSFLLTSLKFFVADEEDRHRARKRGGGLLVPLEFSSGEERYQREPAPDETPERIFERRWALSLLDRVVEKAPARIHPARPPGAFREVEGVPSGAIRRAVCGTGARNEHLRGSAQGGHSPPSQAISRTLSPGNRRYLADQAEVESELRFLAAVLSKKSLAAPFGRWVTPWAIPSVSQRRRNRGGTSPKGRLLVKLDRLRTAVRHPESADPYGFAHGSRSN
jgi:hypothetical protein